MSLRAGCRWVQAVGLTPPPITHRTTPPRSPATMGPRSLNLAATPSSCRFGCQCAILGFGRCVFREQVMSHWDCSSAWTRGNPGNSGCRSWRTAGLAGVWWVHSSAGVGLLWYVCLNVVNRLWKDNRKEMYSRCTSTSMQGFMLSRFIFNEHYLKQCSDLQFSGFTPKPSWSRKTPQTLQGLKFLM